MKSLRVYHGTTTDQLVRHGTVDDMTLPPGSWVTDFRPYAKMRGEQKAEHPDDVRVLELNVPLKDLTVVQRGRDLPGYFRLNKTAKITRLTR